MQHNFDEIIYLGKLENIEIGEFNTYLLTKKISNNNLM